MANRPLIPRLPVGVARGVARAAGTVARDVARAAGTAARVAALALVPTGCAVGSEAQRPAVAEDGMVVHGTVEWGWSLRTPGGEPVELGDYRGRVLFINAWASWCAPCVAEMRSIERLRESLLDTDVAWLLVSPEDPEPVERFMARYGYDLPVLLEAEPAPAVFGLRALPTTWIVDREGRIVLRHRGAADWDRDDVRAFLRSLTAGSGANRANDSSGDPLPAPGSDRAGAPLTSGSSR